MHPDLGLLHSLCKTISAGPKQIVRTKVPHALLVCVIQEKVALFNSSVDLKAKTQACILHQVWQDVLS